MRRILARPAVFGVGLGPAAFSDEDAIATIIRATNCNFGLVKKLVQQIEDTLRANALDTGPGSVTPEVVEIAVGHKPHGERDQQEAM